jgi:hypothetical protein
VKHSEELFTTNNKRGQIYETQIAGPQYVEELDRDFTRDEIKRSNSERKITKPQVLMGYQKRFEKVLCHKGGN